MLLVIHIFIICSSSCVWPHIAFTALFLLLGLSDGTDGFSVCTANIQKGQTKDVYTKKYKYKVKILTDAETTEKNHADKTSKRHGRKLGWAEMVKQPRQQIFHEIKSA